MLKFDEFERVQFGNGEHYLYKNFGDYQICLEPCLSGYCVAIYRVGPDEQIIGLVCPKKCTDFKFKSREMELAFGIDGLKKGESNMVILRAMKFANEFYKSFIN